MKNLILPERVFLASVPVMLIGTTVFYMYVSHDAESVWKSLPGIFYGALSLTILVFAYAGLTGKKGYHVRAVTLTVMFIWSVFVCIPILMVFHFLNENPLWLSPFLVAMTSIIIRFFDLGTPGIKGHSAPQPPLKTFS